MKPIQQEILLVTKSAMCKRQFCEKDRANEINNLSETEQLEKACWDGLLNEILPEVMRRSSTGKQLSLWQIRHIASLLEIELSESIPYFEKEYSINPDFLLQSMLWN